MNGVQNHRGWLLWALPLLALVAYGAKITDFGRQLFADDVSWRKVSSQTATAGVVPDIAFNADASPYAVVADRNLFVPWRKPAPPPEPPKAAPEPPKPQIRRGVYALTGTMQIGNSVIATLKETATNRTKQVRIGDQLQEYNVKTVDNDRVVLAFAGQEEELVLARYTQSGRATPPPAVPQPSAVPTAQVPANPPGGQALSPGVTAPPIPPGGVPGGMPPRIAPMPAQQIPQGGLPPFPPSGSGTGAPVNQSPPGTQAVSPSPVAQPPNPEIIDVGELLRRRREARKQ